jgi:FkbM family methyltransferase
MKTEQIIKEIKSSKYICLFGVGAISYPIITAIRYFTDIKIDFVCDNDPKKWLNFYHDCRCISPWHLSQYGNDVSVIISTQHYKAIKKQLNAMGIFKTFVLTEYRLFNDLYFRNRENISAIEKNIPVLFDIVEDEQSKIIINTIVKNWFDFDIQDVGYDEIYTDDQYYPKGIIELTDHETFVDVGAYNGDTVLDFIKRTNNKFDSIHAFELDQKNFQTMAKNIKKENITLYNFGLSNREGMVNYSTGESQSNYTNVIHQPDSMGVVVKLDDILDDSKATFIKMDIEGAELEALQGAKEIITEHKPKLAICTYHKPRHLWEIPFFIKSINYDYKIYFRHHSPLEYETVCYAII